MLQLHFAFDIIIHPGRVSVSESFLFGMESLKIYIRVSLNNSNWELISLPLNFFPIKRSDSQVYDINISFFIVSNKSFIRWGIIGFWWSERCTPLFITKLGWLVKIESIQDADNGRMWGGSFMIWYNP